MRFIILLSVVGLVQANWDNSYWNTSAGASCPGLGFGCNAPLQWCAHTDPLDKYYCCDVGDGVCWDGSESFQADTNGNLSSTLQACGDKSDTFYCLNSKYESCTERSHQYNICWSNDPSPVAVQYEKQLNDTFSSLTSAQPQATSFTFDIAAMLATATVTSSSSSSSSTSTSSSASNSASPTSSSTNTPSSSGVSGGTIAGAVIGAIAGVALIIAGVIFFLRRRRANKNTSDNVAPFENTHHEPKGEAWQSPDPQELPYSEYRGHYAPTKEPLLNAQQYGSSNHPAQTQHAELPAHVAPVELSSTR